MPALGSAAMARASVISVLPLIVLSASSTII